LFTTLRDALGFAVPIPTLPFAATRKSDVVADPLLFVEDAISKSGCREPKFPCTVSFAYAVEVPRARALAVLSKKNWVLSPAKAVPLANWIAPVPPTAEVEPPLTQVPFIEKHPPVISQPCVPVEVAVVLNLVAETPPPNVLVPCPAPTVIAEAKVEVAVPVAAILLKVPWLAERFAAKELVVVALVPVALTKVRFWKVD
jgi:hypothetical protein